MAHLDPSIIASVPKVEPKKSERYELRIHDLKPEDIVPNGDRYVVEVIDFDESVQLGQILVVTQQAEATNNPLAANVERRGVLAAVVVAKGNGHLLGLPDPRIPVAVGPGVARAERHAADVPMFFEVGDIVLVDHNAKGRALKIVKREIRLVNQIDILAKIPVRLRRNGDDWELE